MEACFAPFTYQNCDRGSNLLLVCNTNRLQYLAQVKRFVNDWLTVTNMVPPVNDGKADLRLPKAGNPEGTKGQVTGESVRVGNRRARLRKRAGVAAV